MCIVRATFEGAAMKKLGLAIAFLVACGPTTRGNGVGDDDGSPDSGTGSGGSGVPRQCDKMDIVFVVDDSGSMAEEQQNLATNFPMFANLLSTYTVNDGQPLDFRIGVTTTGRTLDYTIDLGGGFTVPQHEDGDNGAFKNNCGSQQRWLEHTDPNAATTLACRAKVGTGGPSVEMPMLMSKWALSERAQDMTQAGFLRDDALLAIVMITDEDDSSTTANNFTMDASGTTPTNWNPTDEVAFLDQLKGDHTRWAAAVIAGDGNCSSSFGMAADAKRLKAFVQLGGQQAVFASICDGDLTIGLKKALDQFQAACGAIIL
jgi:hypothetical protein